MVWCDLCKNFMWGLRAQGYKCVDCGYNVHKQCQDEVEPSCQPVKQKVKRSEYILWVIFLRATNFVNGVKKSVEKIFTK